MTKAGKNFSPIDMANQKACDPKQRKQAQEARPFHIRGQSSTRRMSGYNLETRQGRGNRDGTCARRRFPERDFRLSFDCTMLAGRVLYGKNRSLKDLAQEISGFEL